MKRMDDEEYMKHVDKKLDFIGATDFKTHIGKLTLEWPKSLFYKLLERQKYWEADDISDLVKNYSMVNNTCANIMNMPENVELLNNMWQKAIDSAEFTPEEARDIWLKLDNAGKIADAIHIELGWNGKYVNPNMVSLDNIYLGDYKLSHKELFSVCDLNVKDRFNNTISGILIYSKRDMDSEDINLEKSLQMAMSHKDYSMAFDIQFEALHIYRRDTLQPDIPGAVKETVYKGPKILIHDITKTGGDKKEFNPVNVKTFMPQYS